MLLMALIKLSPFVEVKWYVKMAAKPINLIEVFLIYHFLKALSTNKGTMPGQERRRRILKEILKFCLFAPNALSIL